MGAPMSRPANFTSLARGPNVQKDRSPIRCCICRSGGLVGLVRAAKVNRACPSAQRLWCKRRVADDYEEMQRFVPIEDLFKGRHFDRQIIHLVCELVHELQTELAGSGDHDGGSGDLRDPYNSCWP